MKLLIISGAVLVAISLFMLVNSVYADCGNMTGDCDSNGNSNYAGVQEDDGYIDDNNDGVNDENSLPDDSDQSDYYNNYYKHHSHDGVDDSNSNIDDIHLGTHHNHNGHTSDNHKSNHKKAVEKFNVHVYVDFGYAQFGDNDRIRVIVYGPHTLNKPTLDKPGTPIHLVSCNSEECYQDAGVWAFTSWKVPKGASFKACVSSSNGNERCGWGYANSRHESIHVQAD